MKLAYPILLLFLVASCGTSTETKLEYSTSSEQALKEFRQGWVQIMDEGRYGAAEDSYRRVLEHDPDFLIGKSVLARLTLNLEERVAFEIDLFKNKDKVQGDELKLLEVYQGLVRYSNLRDQNARHAISVLNEVIETAEKNLGYLTRKYPNETYLKAEYIEFLHSKYGAKQTLDTLKTILLPEQKKNPFLLGLTATLHAEIDDFDTALEKAKELEEITNNPTIPKPYAVYAYVYFRMKELQLAKTNVDKANELDPLNLDASRLKVRIEALISEQQTAPLTQ